MKDELLDLVSLSNTTTGQDISGALIEVLKKHNVPQDRISLIATDRAPSMVGKYKKAIAFLRIINLLSDFKAYHCLLNQRSLYARQIIVVDDVTTLVKIVNYTYISALTFYLLEFRLLIGECNNE